MQQQARGIMMRPSPVMMILFLLFSSSILIVNGVADDSNIFNTTDASTCVTEGGAEVFSDDAEDCAAFEGLLACPANTTCTAMTENNDPTVDITFEAEIICPESESTNLIDASQNGLCACDDAKINGQQVEETDVDCRYCPPGSEIGTAFIYTTTIDGTSCRGYNCDGSCITVDGDDGDFNPVAVDNGTPTPSSNNTDGNVVEGGGADNTTDVVIVTDLASAIDDGDGDEPVYVFTVLEAEDDRNVQVVIPSQSKLYEVEIPEDVEEEPESPPVDNGDVDGDGEAEPPSQPPTTMSDTDSRYLRRYLQSTSCPPPGSVEREFTPDANSTTTTSEFMLQGDTEIVVCDEDDTEVLANYFVVYEEVDEDTSNGGSNPEIGDDPDYTTTYDFISENSTSSVEALYGPAAPNGQDGIGWIVLAGDLVWYESSTDITIGDSCPTEEGTLIPKDPNFPFTLYAHNGANPPDPEALHGCDMTETNIVGEVLFVYVNATEAPTAPTDPPAAAPVLPPVGFQQDCLDFNISLREDLDSSCKFWCDNGEKYETFDFAEPASEGSNQINRNSVCRCCFEDGTCQDENLQSKWECWTIEENVWDASKEIDYTCEEFEPSILSQTNCEDYCFDKIDGQAFEFDGDADVDGNPVCKCAGYTVCGVEPEEDDGGLSTGALIGIIIGSLLLCLLCLLLLLCCLRRNRDKEEEEEGEDDRYIDPEEAYDSDQEPKLALGNGEEGSSEEESDSDEDSEPKLALTNGTDDDSSEEDSDDESGSYESGSEDDDSEDDDSDEFEDE